MCSFSAGWSAGRRHRDDLALFVDLVCKVSLPAEIGERRDVLRNDLVCRPLVIPSHDPQPGTDMVGADCRPKFHVFLLLGCVGLRFHRRVFG